MTDNEIIKALECCSEPAGKCCCEECPLHHREDSCTTALIKKALELTNRQKAQIEGLQDEVVTKTDMLNKQKSENERYLHSIKLLEKDVQTANAEIERLKNQKCLYAFDGEFKDCIKTDCFYRKKEDEVKSEAIKEFADKFKLTFAQLILGIPRKSKAHSLRGDILHDVHLVIDHVKKEMVGDDNG